MFRRIVAAAAVGFIVVSTITACDDSRTEPAAADPTKTVQTVPESEVAQHETGAESPIGYGLTIPSGATQLGPRVRRRSPELIAAYQEVLREFEKQQALEAAEEGGEQTPETTPTPNPFPTADTFDDLDEPPEPDVTTVLLRVDGDPAEVFQRMLSQVAEVLPGLGVEPKQWSQYCRAREGLYTGCKMAVAGRTVEGRGVRVTVTIDPGDVKTMTAPAGSEKQPVMTVTTVSTDPIDTSDAIEDDEPSPTPPSTPASPASPSPIAPKPPVEATWPKMKKIAPSRPRAELLTDRWKIRSYTTLLLSGQKPAFAMMVTGRRTNGDAVARSYVLAYSTKGEPTRDVVEDRTEIHITYRAKTGKNGPRVTATYTQAGRGNYITLFYHPPGT